MRIRRPLLARGTKAACFGIIRFSTISGHAFQLPGYAFISLEGLNRDQMPLTSSTYQDPFAWNGHPRWLLTFPIRVAVAALLLVVSLIGKSFTHRFRENVDNDKRFGKKFQ